MERYQISSADNIQHAVHFIIFAYQNHYVNVIERFILMTILVFVYLFCRYLFRESSCPLFSFGTDALHAQIFGITYRKHLDLIIL